MKTKSYLSLLFLPFFAVSTIMMMGCGGGGSGSAPEVTMDPGPTTGASPAGASPDPSPGEMKGEIPQVRYTLEDAHLAFARLITPNTLDVTAVKSAYQKYFKNADIVAGSHSFKNEFSAAIYLNLFFHFIREADTAEGGNFVSDYLDKAGSDNKKAYDKLINDDVNTVLYSYVDVENFIKKAEWLQNRIQEVANIYRIPIKPAIQLPVSELALFKVAFILPVKDFIEEKFDADYGSNLMYQDFKKRFPEKLAKLFDLTTFSVEMENHHKTYISFVWFENLPSSCNYQYCLSRGYFGAGLAKENKFFTAP